MKVEEKVEEVAEVVTVVGGYRVRLGNQIHLVDKQRKCTCSRQCCPAIKHVAAYLKAGGQLAPAATTILEPNCFPCPICASTAHGSLAEKEWDCTADRLHYWQWRTDRLRAAQAKMLAGASAYSLEILSTFASNETRDQFLAQHRLTYAAEA